MLHQQLKDQTRFSHQALEKNLIKQIKAIHSISHYVTFLKLMYGYYSSIENRIDPYLSSHESLNFKERRKAHKILQDIQHIIHTEDEISLCTKLPFVDSYSRALGVFYVLEGSTLGGKIIANIVSNQLQLTNTIGLSFFLSYGDKTQLMWEAFTENLKQSFTPTETEEIIHAANDTFLTFKNWIDLHATN